MELTQFGRSAPDDIADELRSQINGGQLGPGDRLPNERELASQFGVSRITLREAIRLLVGQGYLTSKRGNAGGTYVSDLNQPQLAWLQRVRADPDWVADLVEFRKAIEMRAATLAAGRSQTAELEEMRRTIEETAEPASRGLFRQADHRFHLAVARASGSGRLQAAVVRARGELFVPVDTLTFQDHYRQTSEEHAAIADAIANHDPVAAAAAMEAHLDASLKDLFDLVLQAPQKVRRRP
jgi:GntR family transcriptional repressor for pyruvate dehydrogenase complex